MITILFITVVYVILIYLNDRKHRKVEKQLREYADTAIKQRQEAEDTIRTLIYGTESEKLIISASYHLRDRMNKSLWAGNASKP